MKITKSQLKQIILDEGLFANIRGAMSDEGEGQIEFDTNPGSEFRELIYDLVKEAFESMVKTDPMFVRHMANQFHAVATGVGLHAKRTTHGPRGTVVEPTGADATQVVPPAQLPDRPRRGR